MPQTRTTQLWTSPFRATGGRVRRILIVALTALMLAAVVAIAPSAQALDSNDEDYWEARTIHDDSWCFKHEGGGLWSNAHGYLTPPQGEPDAGKNVVLNEYQSNWYGDHWELLVVKAGSSGGDDGNGNMVYHHPVAGDEYGAPDGKDVSHWIVCKGVTPEDEPGKIIVEKVTNVASEQLFNFTASYDADGFELANGGSNDSGELKAGDYSVAETPIPAGWALTSATCDDGSEPSAIGLDAGETVTCTFTNTKDEDKPGRIIVEKVTNVASEQLFNFTASYDADGFELANGGSNDSGELKAGDYSVAETPIPAGWALTSATCDDGSEPSAIGLDAGETVTCTFTNTYTPPEEPEYKITFVKQVCEDYSDIWKNPNGDNLEENAEELTGGDVTWSEVTPGAEKMGDCKPAAGWSFRIGSEKVSGGSPGNLSYVTGEYRTVTTGSDGRVTATLTEGEAALALKGTGNLWISEEAQSGFGFGAIRCGNDILNGDNLEWVAFDPVPSAPLTEATVVQGGHKYCYAYNVAPDEPELAHLKLVKVVSGGTAGPDDWRLYAATSVEGKTDRNFDNLGGKGVFEDVYAGVAYKLSESSGPARYTASSWSCVIGGGDQISEAAADPVVLSSGMITLEPFEEATCTITNRYRPPTDPDTPRIDIEKATNGIDADKPALGPVVKVGSPVEWTYVVTNTGNVGLTDVKVVDDKVGAITCPKTTLIILEQMTCTASGKAELGQYANVGTVTGSYGSIPVTDNDPSHYSGTESLVGGTAQLGDTVWLDVNKNGVQDSGEVGYNGADVILKDGDGNVVGTLTTATGPWVGFYSFVGLDAGTYTAMLDLSTIGTYKVSTATAFTVTLAEGDEYLDADFGLYEDAAPPTTTVPPEETLPTTGAETAGLTALAAALLVLGALGVLASRRRGIEDQ